MARENSGWGYDRIVGALANLGHIVSDQTVGNILRHHGIAQDPKEARPPPRNPLLRRILRFSQELISSRLKCSLGGDWQRTTSYSFFIHLESRRVTLGGIT